jgi:7,8-dihydroneopterin aldolase/epimerase/oxygenase
MPAIMTIELTYLRFHAFHGLFPEEKKTGNDFDVQLIVDYYPGEEIITSIDATVNYARLYEIIKTEMQKPRELLETLAMEITEIIHESFQQVIKIDINIKKLHPPITQFTGSVGVRYCRVYTTS